jgi:molybdate transport system substrate-binding protein
MLGEVDAIIGWRVFAAWCPDQIDCVDIPREHTRVRNIPAALSVYSKQRETARQFIDFLASEEGKAIFESHGYHVTPPEV